MRDLGVICDMKRRRRHLEGLYSGFFAKKRVSRVIVAILFAQRGDIRSQVVTFPPGGASRPFRPNRRLQRSVWSHFPGRRTGYRPQIKRAAGFREKARACALDAAKTSHKPIPNLASDDAVTRYSMMVRAQPVPMPARIRYRPEATPGRTRTVGDNRSGTTRGLCRAFYRRGADRRRISLWAPCGLSGATIGNPTPTPTTMPDRRPYFSRIAPV